MSEKEIKNDLFYRYLEICNQALAYNRDRFPFKQILGAAERENNTKAIEVCIIDDHPVGAYVMNMDAHTLFAKPHEDCADCAYDVQWRVTKTYLEDVIAHPEDYIKNPAKINWEWLTGTPQDDQKAQ